MSALSIATVSAQSSSSCSSRTPPSVAATFRSSNCALRSLVVDSPPFTGTRAYCATAGVSLLKTSACDVLPRALFASRVREEACCVNCRASSSFPAPPLCSARQGGRAWYCYLLTVTTLTVDCRVKFGCASAMRPREPTSTRSRERAAADQLCIWLTPADLFLCGPIGTACICGKEKAGGIDTQRASNESVIGWNWSNCNERKSARSADGQRVVCSARC